jgi:hypothetical protein
MYDKYRGRVAFFVVYMKEAHPEGGWFVIHNRDEDVVLTDPTTDFERAAAAGACVVRTTLQIPVLVDYMDNAVARVRRVARPALSHRSRRPRRVPRRSRPVRVLTRAPPRGDRRRAGVDLNGSRASCAGRASHGCAGPPRASDHPAHSSGRRHGYTHLFRSGERCSNLVTILRSASRARGGGAHRPLTGLC